MPTQRLQRQLTSDARPVFLQRGRFPLFRGIAQTEGSNYLCGWCGEGVLATNILPRQLWDLTLGCFACDRRSVVPSRPAGSPLGRNVAGPFPRTKLVVLAAPIELPAGAVYASAG